MMIIITIIIAIIRDKCDDALHWVGLCNAHLTKMVPFIESHLTPLDVILIILIIIISNIIYKNDLRSLSST